LYRKVLTVLSDKDSLKKKSVLFPKKDLWTEDHFSALKDLLDTFSVKQGLGLAAPQIGILKRAVVVNPKKLGLDDEKEVLVLINPVVETSGPTVRSPEACFSIPGVQGIVERQQVCSVSYIDESGDSQEIAAEGYAAVCLQHEIDHLDGVLYIDRMGQLSRKMLLKKVEKSEKKRIAAAKLAKEAFERDHRSLEGGASSKKTSHSKKRKPKVRKKRVKKSKKR
tara:strand:- start:682 stop:1350 length:669 start_codon:yes stop_codon:yes gene_type:complete